MPNVNIVKVSFDDYDEEVTAEPQVPCSEQEVLSVLNDIYIAVNNDSYYCPRDERNYSFFSYFNINKKEQDFILKDLTYSNFVAKIKNLNENSKARKLKGYPDEYLYVFKYPCEIYKRDDIKLLFPQKVMIYIKINNRKIPNKIVIVVSFHENRK